MPASAQVFIWKIAVPSNPPRFLHRRKVQNKPTRHEAENHTIRALPIIENYQTKPKNPYECSILVLAASEKPGSVLARPAH